jgi:hypothetical protein
MNPLIKNIITNSGLFEEDTDFMGMFFTKRPNDDVTNELQQVVNEIAEEYIRAVQLWKDSEDEVNSSDYIAGYQTACNDIIEELRERFK